MKALTDAQVKKVVAVLQILRVAKENEFSDTENYDCILYAYGFLKTLNDYITDYMLNYDSLIIEVTDRVIKDSDMTNWYNKGRFYAMELKDLMIKELEEFEWDVTAVISQHFPEILLSLLEN